MAATVTAFTGVRKAAGERVVVLVLVVPLSTHAARISFRAAAAGVRLPARRHRLVPTRPQRIASPARFTGKTDRDSAKSVGEPALTALT